MNNLKLVFAALLCSIQLVGAEEGKVPDKSREALKQFETLKKKGESITKKSNEKEVRRIMGEPEHRGIAGWSVSDTQVWNYLEFTDDSRYLRFDVRFSPDSGCYVAALKKDREKPKKEELRVITGTVESVLPYPPSGFLCQVRIGEGRSRPVAVASRERVKGNPAKGASIRIEHSGSDFLNIYVGAHSLKLESITFTDPPVECE